MSAQRARIVERLERYNNPGTAREQLAELGDLSPYQHYKINTVSAFLHRALAKIAEGSYGRCDRCGGEIANARLLLVPAAVQCATCGQEEDRRPAHAR
ncbi:MAG: TraR/DksA C4-type zinc finger protein [Flavobacteriales bacterium]|nr:TraR/DksA C4-type zinc finger protein [Flavobacteriales bacterium]